MTRSQPNRREQWRWLLVILLIGAGIRLWLIPSPTELRDVDEYYYLIGGPQVWEGLPPAYHYAFAGPETWVGWIYAACLTGRYVAFPTAEESAVPPQIRTLVATNHALWDMYFDLTPLRLLYIGISIAVGLIAIASAFKYGVRRGGVAGGVLLAAMVSLLPVLVEFSGMARPYSFAWSCVFIAIACLSRFRDGSRWMWLSGICMGLAVASRVEMVAVLPMLVLLELWPGSVSWKAFLKRSAAYVGLVVLTTMVVAPWCWTNLLGNLRAIATIRLAPPNAEASRFQIILDFAWTNAMGLPIVFLVLASIFAAVRPGAARATQWTWPAAVVGLLLGSTFLSSTGFGLRHQGPAFLSVLLMMPLAIGLLAEVFDRRVTWSLVISTAAIALYQSIVLVIATKANYVPDDATAWVNQHLSAGSTLYLSPSWNDPLPTPASADVMWDEVMSRDAVRLKYAQGATRLNLVSSGPPRGLSEQLVMTERATARRFYILGGRSEFVGPRFNVRRYYSSPIFGLQDPVPEYSRTGGAIIWRGMGPPPGLSEMPAMKWVDANGHGTYVYMSQARK